MLDHFSLGLCPEHSADGAEVPRLDDRKAVQYLKKRENMENMEILAGKMVVLLGKLVVLLGEGGDLSNKACRFCKEIL